MNRAAAPVAMSQRPDGKLRRGNPGGHTEEGLSYTDKQIACRDCGTMFTFTAGEQEFYASKGLTNQPTRCPSCRSTRKLRTNNFNEQPDDGGGYVKYGHFASFGGRTPRQMHPTTCADCGQATEVPFVPRGDRPVFCSNCYSKQKAR
jgi:CxxC-x17-CxxC domain-containing protein